jgi:hypothetical protein
MFIYHGKVKRMRNQLIEKNMKCPACNEWDVCYEDCICPTCSREADDETLVDEMQAWEFFAPLMHSLKSENIEWGWYRENKYPKGYEYGLEITDYGYNTWIEVARWGDKFVASQWTQIRARTYDEPAEHDVVADIASADPAEVCDWISCIPDIAETVRPNS